MQIMNDNQKKKQRMQMTNKQKNKKEYVGN